MLCRTTAWAIVLVVCPDEVFPESRISSVRACLARLLSWYAVFLVSAHTVSVATGPVLQHEVSGYSAAVENLVVAI